MSPSSRLLAPVVFRVTRFRYAAGTALVNASAITLGRIWGNQLSSNDWFPHLAAFWTVFFIIGSLLDSPQLELTAEHFAFTSALRHGFVPWAGIKSISVRRVWLRRRVCYEFVSSKAKMPTEDSRKPPSVRTDHLRFNYGLDPGKLAAVMTEFRNKYSDGLSGMSPGRDPAPSTPHG